MAKYTKTATGIVQLAYDTPKAVVDVSLFTLLPYDALVKKIKIEYIKVPRHEADAAWNASIEQRDEECIKQKRHQAAVKANATRKAKKAESEAAND